MFDTTSLINRLNQINQYMQQNAAKVLETEMGGIVKAAENEVPVDSGETLASIHTEIPNQNSVDLVADTDYAIFVHEDLTAYHESGKARFIADPMLALAPAALQRAALKLVKGVK